VFVVLGARILGVCKGEGAENGKTRRKKRRPFPAAVRFVGRMEIGGVVTWIRLYENSLYAGDRERDGLIGFKWCNGYGMVTVQTGIRI